MNQEIKNALRSLDPDNDAHWTSKGLPQVSVVANVSGILTLTRGELNDVAPNYDREAARRARNPAWQAPVPAPVLVSAAESLPAAGPGDEEDDDEFDDEPAALEEDNSYNHYANQTAIMEWIASEAQKREQAAERQGELLAAGLEPHELPPRRSPLDQAAARVVGYGYERARYPAPPRGVAGLIEIARRNSR